MRRHPSAVEFRTAWDAALAEAWRRVQEAAFDRVINGETEVWERDGVTTVRHRPCAAHLVVHMLERANQLQAAADAVARTQAANVMSENVAKLRAEIMALAEKPDDGTCRVDPAKPEPRYDAETLVMRQLQTLSQGFVEPPVWDAPADWQHGIGKEKRQNM